MFTIGKKGQESQALKPLLRTGTIEVFCYIIGYVLFFFVFISFVRVECTSRPQKYSYGWYVVITVQKDPPVCITPPAGNG